MSQSRDTVTVGTKTGKLAPDFTLEDLDGNQVSLSDFRGKTVFLNFWATWCPPCRAEMPDIEAVHQENKYWDVVVIGIDIQETRETVQQFTQNGGYSWLFLLDTSGKVAKDYEVKAIPTSFFLDKDGLIQAMQSGSMSKEQMETLLLKAMP